MDLISPVILIVSLGLFVHAIFSLYLLLYAWEYPERLDLTHGPQQYREPTTGFTVLLPARHEQDVIRATIKRVCAANYPERLVQVVAICHKADEATIAEVERAIREIGSKRVRLVVFGGDVINKPRALNLGLQHALHPVVTIVDAEDDVDPDLFNIVNTVMLEERTGIVQAGVQLMNFRDRWFAVHNCLEYFFWFQSRLHFHARVGMIPLGGNTVFIRRALIEQVGGWDETCLTEDADVGLRLSTLGEPIRVVYDAQHVTREETPDSIAGLVRQRTRWNQGFMHVLRKGDWRRLPSWQQRALAIYTFSYPLVQAPITLLWPIAVLAAMIVRVPFPIAMASFLPIYALLFQLTLTVVGAFMFADLYGLRVPVLMPLKMAATFMPYQWLLGFSAARAAYRQLRRVGDWEKTAHVGAHRRSLTPSPSSAPPAPWSPLPQALSVGFGSMSVTSEDTARRFGMVVGPQTAARPAPAVAAGGLSAGIAAGLSGFERGRSARIGPVAPAAAGIAAGIWASFVVSSQAAVESTAQAALIPHDSVHVRPWECLACGRSGHSGARFCLRCGSLVIPVIVPRAPTDVLRAPAGRRRHARLATAYLGLLLALVITFGFLEIVLAK
jgi:cellulose synthase/poly-beta-1,6-N-acetylglucosamine synthase-like glycosyltransferase